MGFRFLAKSFDSKFSPSLHHFCHFNLTTSSLNLPLSLRNMQIYPNSYREKVMQCEHIVGLKGHGAFPQHEKCLCCLPVRAVAGMQSSSLTDESTQEIAWRLILMKCVAGGEVF